MYSAVLAPYCVVFRYNGGFLLMEFICIIDEYVKPVLYVLYFVDIFVEVTQSVPVSGKSAKGLPTKYKPALIVTELRFKAMRSHSALIDPTSIDARSQFTDQRILYSTAPAQVSRPI
jgi:hypothetical protein